MPTKKTRKEVLFTPEDLHRIDYLRTELQSPYRAGTPRYVPFDLTLAEFIAKLALDMAAQIEQELAEE